MTEGRRQVVWTAHVGGVVFDEEIWIDRKLVAEAMQQNNNSNFDVWFLFFDPTPPGVEQIIKVDKNRDCEVDEVSVWNRLSRRRTEVSWFNAKREEQRLRLTFQRSDVRPDYEK